MAVFRLEPDAGGDGAHAAGRPDLGNVLLLQNARWFTRIRWSVVTVLAGYGLAAAAVPEWLAQAGFQAHAGWPWLLALLLALINTATILSLRRLTPQSDGSAIAHNIWLQIGTDLIVLSMLVYLCGPLHTVVPFAYLFHISLACIFFARRDSFLVTLLSATLYLGLATLVIGGMVPARSLLIDGPDCSTISGGTARRCASGSATS